MTIEIIIPRVGETTSCVTIIRWLKQVGEYVTKGEPLLEVETDKATLEIESFGEGVLQQIFVPEGGEAQAMQVVAVLEVGRCDPLRLSNPLLKSLGSFVVKSRIWV